MGCEIPGQVRRGFLPLLLVAFACLSASVPVARSQDVCDDKTEQGEGPSPFFGMVQGVFAYALAEKACGAPAGSIATTFMRAVASQGCGPTTPVYNLVERMVKPLDALDLKGLAAWAENDGVESPKQVQEWARTNVQSYGGCPALLDLHQLMSSSPSGSKPGTDD